MNRADAHLDAVDEARAEAARPQERARGVWGRIGRSFYFAFAGIFYLFRTQRNARIEAGVGAIVCAAAAWVRIGRIEWAILVLTIAMVLVLEGLNTAIEAAIDLACPEVHPLAKVAKDVAAAMVLIAAVASVCVGLLILGPPMWAKIATRL